jgi:hypothetical protein
VEVVEHQTNFCGHGLHTSRSQSCGFMVQQTDN